MQDSLREKLTIPAEVKEPTPRSLADRLPWFWLAVIVVMVLSLAVASFIGSFEPPVQRGQPAGPYGRTAMYAIACGWAIAVWMICFRTRIIKGQVSMPALFALATIMASACWLVGFLRPSGL